MEALQVMRGYLEVPPTLPSWAKCSCRKEVMEEFSITKLKPSGSSPRNNLLTARERWGVISQRPGTGTARLPSTLPPGHLDIQGLRVHVYGLPMNSIWYMFSFPTASTQT